MPNDTYPNEDDGDNEFADIQIPSIEVNSAHLKQVSSVFHLLADTVDIQALNQMIYASLPETNDDCLYRLETLVSLSEAYRIVGEAFKLSKEQKRELVDMLWAERVMPYEEEAVKYKTVFLENIHAELARQINSAVYDAMTWKECLDDE